MEVQSLTPVIPAPSADGRTPGIHLGRVIRSVAFDYKLLDADWLEDVSLVEVPGQGTEWWDNLDITSKLRMSMGLAWEQWYLPQIPGVVHQPGELSLSGIYMTPDGESISTVYVSDMELACHECKLTYKSINTVGALHREWLWVAQMKGYCKAMKTNVAYLHVLFVCGDYSRPIRPQIRVWRIVFTDEEIESNWELMEQHVRSKGHGD